jgi:hypothetical protein
MSTDLPVGADATNVTEQLYDLIGDDELFDQLEQLAERDANADARQVIFDRMQMLSDHPDVLKVIEQLQIDPTAEMNPPEATPADLSDVAPEQSDKVPGGQGTTARLAEDALRSIRRAAGLLTEDRMIDEDGSKLEHILNRFKHEVKKFEETGEVDKHLHHALYDYYKDLGEIPYDVDSDGDPYAWIEQNLESHLNGGGIVNGTDWGAEDRGLERESVMHGDYAEEERDPHSVDGGMDNPLIQDEGAIGTALGGVAGAVLGGPVGAVRGAMAGNTIGNAISSDKTDENDMSLFNDSTCNMSEAGESCPVHGVEECWANSGEPEASPLAGQYGHSGKMKEVGKETSFLDRLKELSGMIRN